MCFLVGAGKTKNIEPVRNVSECDAFLFPMLSFPFLSVKTLELFKIPKSYKAYF